MKRGKQHKPQTFKSFKDLRGSKSDAFKGVTPEQLGHDRQIGEINPNPGGKPSPLINPGEPGHPMDPSRIGESMAFGQGPEFY